MEIVKIEELLRQAYAEYDWIPEKEADLHRFEDKFQVSIPAEYRWLLQFFGACHFSDPWLNSLKSLFREYPGFLQTWEEYQKGGYTLPEVFDPFILGGFGDGSLLVLDQVSGKVYMLIHDCAEDIPLELIAESFTALIQEQAEGAMEMHRMLKEE